MPVHARIYMMECSDQLDGPSNADTIDWWAVHERVVAAATQRGVSQRELCDHVGLDTRSGTLPENIRSLPRFQTALTVADYLGVPSSWLLTGEGSPGPACASKWAACGQLVQGTTDSTVIQGNRAGTLIVNNGPTVSEHEQELLRMFRAMPIRQQVALLHAAYRISDGETA